MRGKRGSVIRFLNWPLLMLAAGLLLSFPSVSSDAVDAVDAVVPATEEKSKQAFTLSSQTELGEFLEEELAWKGNSKVSHSSDGDFMRGWGEVVHGELGASWNRQALTNDLRHYLSNQISTGQQGRSSLSGWLRERRDALRLGLLQSSADYAANYFLSAAESEALGKRFVRNINIDYRTAVGSRRWEAGLSALGSLREKQDDAVIWQLRGFASGGSSAGANAGLIYRRVANENSLLGFNLFLDYESHGDYNDNFWRWSYGGELRTSWLDTYLNYYLPITDPQFQTVKGNRYAVYTRRGYDVAFALHSPSHPWLAGELTYYNFSGKYGQKDEKGLRYGLRLQSVWGGQKLGGKWEMLLEVDDKSSGRSRLGGQLTYKYEFNKAVDGGEYRLEDKYDPRAYFYAPARREYSQRISRALLNKQEGLLVTMMGLASAESVVFTSIDGAMVTVTSETYSFTVGNSLNIRTGADTTVNINATGWALTLYSQATVRFPSPFTLQHLGGTVRSVNNIGRVPIADINRITVETSRIVSVVNNGRLVEERVGTVSVAGGGTERFLVNSGTVSVVGRGAARLVHNSGRISVVETAGTTINLLDADIEIRGDASNVLALFEGRISYSVTSPRHLRARVEGGVANIMQETTAISIGCQQMSQRRPLDADYGETSCAGDSNAVISVGVNTTLQIVAQEQTVIVYGDATSLTAVAEKITTGWEIASNPYLFSETVRLILMGENDVVILRGLKAVGMTVTQTLSGNQKELFCGIGVACYPRLQQQENLILVTTSPTYRGLLHSVSGLQGGLKPFSYTLLKTSPSWLMPNVEVNKSNGEVRVLMALPAGGISIHVGVIDSTPITVTQVLSVRVEQLAGLRAVLNAVAKVAYREDGVTRPLVARINVAPGAVLVTSSLSFGDGEFELNGVSLRFRSQTENGTYTASVVLVGRNADDGQAVRRVASIEYVAHLSERGSTVLLIGGGGGSGIEVNDLYRSVDGGVNWEVVADVPFDVVHGKAVFHKGRVWVMSNRGDNPGLWSSADGGRNWERHTNSGPGSGGSGYFRYQFFLHNNRLYMSAGATSHFANVFNPAKTEKTANVPVVYWDGETWISAGAAGYGASGDVVVVRNAIIPHKGHLLALGGAINGDTRNESSVIYKSTDNGATWISINNDFTPGYDTEVISHKGILLAIGGGSGYDNLWESKNDGNTFTTRGLPQGGDVNLRVVEVKGKTELLMVGGYFNQNVWSSSDGGASWIQVDTTLNGVANKSPFTYGGVSRREGFALVVLE